MKRQALRIVISLLILAPPLLGAQSPAARSAKAILPMEALPENDDIRARWMEDLITAPRDRALAFRKRTESNMDGRWRLEVIRGESAFYTAIVPDQDLLYGQGAWIVKRKASDGSFVQAKVFLRGDPNTFLRLYPFGDRSKLDLVLYRGVLRRDVVLPVPFQKLLTLPVREIIGWARDSVDWDLLSPVPGLYGNLGFLVGAIRERLPDLRYSDDGALDEAGRAVYIASGQPMAAPGLNCSGFVKWVIDGILKPITGRYLAVAPLAERHENLRGSSFTQPYERARDPFFGLDWAWNLGKAVSDALYPHRKNNILDNEVRLPPFALMDKGSADPANGGQNYQPYPAAFEIGGYRVDGLRPILYILAIREPGSFYIAAFNRGMGDGPSLRQFFHEALFFPYFDESGEFRVAVFESSAETSLEAVIRRYPDEFVHLVRVPAQPEFDPQELPPLAPEESGP